MCDCITKIEEQLKPHGIELDTAYSLTGGATLLAVGTVPIGGGRKNKAPKVFASYCPFCGEPYSAAQQEKK